MNDRTVTVFGGTGLVEVYGDRVCTVGILSYQMGGLETRFWKRVSTDRRATAREDSSAGHAAHLHGRQTIREKR